MNFSKSEFSHFADTACVCFAMTTSYKNPSGCKWPLWPNSKVSVNDSKTRDAEVLLILKTAVLGILISHCHSGRASGSRDGTGAQ